jgi:hypothetical protein
MPPEVLNLVDYGRIRVAADRIGVESIDRRGSVVVFTFKGQGGPEPHRVLRLIGERPDVTLAPPSSLKLDLAWTAAKARPRVPPRSLGAGASRGQPPLPSWWTARATAGEVTPGFSKEAILRPEKEDPRGPSGVLTRVGGVLGALVSK